ncbi:hypothetical protein [Streptomyces sp. CBMA123]|uniref:hypothetical protein n=1 Tax=Streptomyces sp. CBMA123 TaxID=1896313 RepID=UPI001661F362|nr:hypothetical protein [Streptomyces sp. CBMA123]
MAVLAAVAGAFAVTAGDPVRESARDGSSACGGSTDVQCLANKVAWNGTGLVIRLK